MGVTLHLSNGIAVCALTLNLGVGAQAQERSIEATDLPQVLADLTEQIEGYRSEISVLRTAIGAAEARIAALTSRAEQSEGLVPKGAVVSFDLSDGCPGGWVAFEDAYGRFIIGSGRGDGLQNRTLRAMGGEETHELSLSELPPQKLTLPGVAIASDVDRYNAGGQDYWAISTESRDIDIGGSGDPISMLPPFIALQYCKKL